MPILAAVPLLALAAALRQRRVAFHWWVLPGALYLHAWMWTGAARTPAFLAAFLAFLALVGLAVLRGAPPPRRASSAGAPPARGLPPGSGASLPAVADPAPAPSRPGPVAPAVPERGTPPPPPEPAEPAERPEPAPRAPVEAAPFRLHPPAIAAAPADRGAGLLAALEGRASAAQRAALWPQLEQEGAGLVAAEGPPPRLVPGAGRWGGATVEGARLEWELLISPANATVLAISVEGGGRGPATVLVPADRPGVKALGMEGGRVRWAGRGVFVPGYLVLRGD